ncbi:MAG: ribonucleotide-diphosphate reductase subunit beta, partial [Thermoleophilaceae bacterium]|nr:ribonucleotide-diphosphate reductase subunit beta [Thermoleophilaceae bacterium]
MAIATPTQSPLDKISYEDLYRRWEQGHWRATEIDFARDREQWQADFSDFERQAAVWNYALFMWGEDAVTDGLSPYIDAAPLEEQKYFIATQQVDEARHAVFFNRFMHEVVGIGDGSVASGLQGIRPQLTWGFEQVFGRLETACDELRRDPSVPRLAAAVALYHLVIEATLAQTGQHFINSYLQERDLLPGFRAGMENVEADEQRHIGFGVKLLADLRRMDPEVPHAVAEMLREVLPWAIAVIVPPGWDERYLTTFGSTFEDLGEAGVTSIMTKLRSAGMPLDELPGPSVFPVLGTPRERAERAKRLLRCGYIGEKTG